MNKLNIISDNHKTRSRNFMLTRNNPQETLEEYFNYCKYHCESVCMQKERGENGTEHF